MIVLMALIAVSMAITVIAQPLRGRFGPQTTSTAPTTTSSQKTGKEKIQGTSPDTRQISATFRPGGKNVIEAKVGDLVTLFVEVEEPQQVLIPKLGLDSFADPYAPARFDVLLRSKGLFQVRSARNGNLGTITSVSAERK